MKYKLSTDEYTRCWAEGFVAKCAELETDPELLVKHAQIASTSDVVQGVGNKLFGDSGWGQAATTGLDIGTYLTPYLGTARAATDSLSDFGNVFQHGIGMGERAKYLGSGLANAAFAGSSIFTGGAYGLNNLKILKPLTGLIRRIPGVRQLWAGGADIARNTRLAAQVPRAGEMAGDAQRITKGLKPMSQIRDSARASLDASHAGWLASDNPLSAATRYSVGISRNPYSRPAGFINRVKYMGYGAPRQVLPMAGMMMRPTEEDQNAPIGIPPAVLQSGNNGGHWWPTSIRPGYDPSGLQR